MTHVDDLGLDDLLALAEPRHDLDLARAAVRLVQPQDDRLLVGLDRKVVVLAALDRVEDDVAVAREREGRSVLGVGGNEVREGVLGRRGDAAQVERVVVGAGDGGHVRLGEGAAVGEDCERTASSVSRARRAGGASERQEDAPAKENLCVPWSCSASGIVAARRSESRKVLPSHAWPYLLSLMSAAPYPNSETSAKRCPACKTCESQSSSEREKGARERERERQAHRTPRTARAATSCCGASSAGRSRTGSRTCCERGRVRRGVQEAGGMRKRGRTQRRRSA